MGTPIITAKLKTVHSNKQTAQSCLSLVGIELTMHYASNRAVKASVTRKILLARFVVATAHSMIVAATELVPRR